MLQKFELLIFLILTINCVDAETKPNIVIIVADDLGFNDVSFHGSLEIPTPNIDALCYNGVILNRFYTLPLCTPSRSSLLTGKYSTKLGMQHYVIISDEPWGLPLKEKILPQYFKEAGYKTALVGKWHLGFHEKMYTPTFRGFDTHYGYLGPYIGYYDHSLIMLDRNYSRGLDMRRNLEMVTDVEGKYATEIFTNEAVNLIRNHDVDEPLFLLLTHLAPHTGNEDQPMEAPADILEKFNHIKNEKRRTLAGMISVMDEGVGKVVEAIKNKGIMENTIIMFLSDNGGPTHGIHSTEASNYPLRGQKASVWEGGCRVPACIYSPLIKNNQRVTNEFMHITDILPTMAAAANIKIKEKSLDGINQWKTITKAVPTKRNEILYNIESVFGFSGLMSEGWKIVNGSENIQNANWFGSSGSDVNTTFESYIDSIFTSTAAQNLPQLNVEKIQKMLNQSTTKCSEKTPITKCNPLEQPCLFNIINDPCERNNLAEKYPGKVKHLKERLSHHISQMVPSVRKPSDPMSNPLLHNGTWTYWMKDEVIIKRERENDENGGNLHLMIILVVILAMLCSVIFVIFVKWVKRSKKYLIQS